MSQFLETEKQRSPFRLQVTQEKLLMSNVKAGVRAKTLQTQGQKVRNTPANSGTFLVHGFLKKRGVGSGLSAFP